MLYTRVDRLLAVRVMIIVLTLSVIEVLDS